MNRFQLARRVLAPAVVALLMTWGAPAGSAMADDGDSFPPPPAGATDPAVTAHRTTFDNIAPALDENTSPPGGYIPSKATTCTKPGTGYIDPQWRLVNGDTPVALEGQVSSSKLAWDDNPIDHHSRDRNFFVVPDLAYAHLLAFGNFHVGEDNELGRIEVEAESAAFPSWALPMAGDRVHVEGSHIWDCAHDDNGSYRTEIHPPTLVMSLRDAADHAWQKDCQAGNPPDADCVNGKVTTPERPGWTDAMPGLGSVPVPVTRADVYASSDGGEAREQLTCFSSILLPPPPGCPPDWYQDIRGTYDLFVPAPPRPDPDAQLVTKLIPRSFLPCSSDNDCGGALDELASHPERFTFTEQNTLFGPGVAIHIDIRGDEPASLLYGFGFTFEVGWNRVATFVPRRLKVTIEGFHVANTTDGGLDDDGEFEISSLIGDQFRHVLLTGGPKQVEYNSHWDVPDTEEVNVGNYGVKSSGSECALDAKSGADPGPCQTQFDVTLLPGQPLRVFFRAEDQNSFATNDELGSVERVATEATNFDIGEHIEWFQEHTSAGDDALDGDDCGTPKPTPCLRVTYKIEDDPIPAPAVTTLSTGQPTVVQGGATWLTSASDILLQATAPNGPQANDPLEIHARFWRAGTPEPADSTCGPGGNGVVFCTLHLNANDGADGQYTLEYWSVDTSTNAIEAPHTATFQLDDTAPTTAASLAGTLVRGWYDTPVTVSLPASDGPGVGVDHTAFSVDGGPFDTYLGPFVVSGDSGLHMVLFSSADRLANAESTKFTSFKIDTTPPALGVNSASDGPFSYTQDELLGGVFTNATSLTVSYATSDALSGIFAVRLDGITVGSSATANGTAIVSLPSGISTHTLVAEDVAGNLTTLTFQVVSVPPGTFAGGVAPQGAGFWKNAVANGDNTAAQLADFLAEVDVASRAFGAPDNRYPDATLANYQSYLAPGANASADQKVSRELLTAWLNLVSGREPAAQKIDVKSVNGWPTVVTNTSGSSVTTALNLVRESERRLEQNPSNSLLDTTQTLLDKLNNGQIIK